MLLLTVQGSCDLHFKGQYSKCQFGLRKGLSFKKVSAREDGECLVALRELQIHLREPRIQALFYVKGWEEGQAKSG